MMTTVFKMLPHVIDVTKATTMYDGPFEREQRTESGDDGDDGDAERLLTSGMT